MVCHWHGALKVIQLWLQFVSHASSFAILWRPLPWCPVAMPSPTNCRPGSQFSFLKLLHQVFYQRRRNVSRVRNYLHNISASPLTGTARTWNSKLNSNRLASHQDMFFTLISSQTTELISLQHICVWPWDQSSLTNANFCRLCSYTYTFQIVFSKLQKCRMRNKF